MHLEIGLIIFGLALLLLVLFSIPILLKLWRAASDVTVTLQTLNERLPAILKNMEEISDNINDSTTAINEQVQKYADMSQRVQLVVNEVVVGLETISPLILQSPFFRKMTNGIALVKGVRVFFDVLTGKQKA